MTSAAARALGITEVLEHILSCSSMRDLLQAYQRVNKRFNASIQTSPALQRKLFLKPEKERNDWELDSESDGFIKNSSSEYPYHIAFVNPLAFTDYTLEDKLSPYKRENSSGTISLRCSPREMESYAHCLDMFLTQPPVEGVSVAVYAMDWDRKFTYYDLYTEGGLQVKDLYKVFRPGSSYPWTVWRRSYLWSHELRRPTVQEEKALELGQGEGYVYFGEAQECEASANGETNALEAETTQAEDRLE
ncbi:hypothetical protein LTR36_004803 [Oleoguttula mirabilis]|uniref:F-box protein n=1 Tax=Oleoguttula mirabilis TaxID=1507867 RepID=A0AAV9JEN1_9PEZI|nr:hypothetical protein LTR36_004803 [Oleoguttula mirabilis]